MRNGVPNLSHDGYEGAQSRFSFGLIELMR